MKPLTLMLACCLLVSCSTRAADTCPVGTWKARGNGAAEWMARHVRGMHVDIGMREGMLQLMADGRYVSGVRLDAKATLREGGAAATHGPMSVQAHGHWRLDGDQLILEPQSQQTRGSIDYVTPTGQKLHRPMPVAAAGAMRMGFTCHGDTLVTRKTFPGMADPMVQRYVRVR